MNLAESYAIRRCLDDCDVARLRGMWAKFAPAAPQPSSDKQVLAAIHYARTLGDEFSIRQRAYSHSWLLGEGLPSGLPDELRPRAERLCPVKKTSVGISVNLRSRILQPAKPLVVKAMSDAVMECYEDGKQDDAPLIRKRMFEAKDREMMRLFGLRPGTTIEPDPGDRPSNWIEP
jgi:hypothetical protein